MTHYAVIILKTSLYSQYSEKLHNVESPHQRSWSAEQNAECSLVITKVTPSPQTLKIINKAKCLLGFLKDNR